MWQKCPICNGEGRVTGNGTTSSVHQVCSVCRGAKIISELNGLPPNNSMPLPTDEEIEEQFTIGDTSYPHMIDGAKWMRDKILNQNK